MKTKLLLKIKQINWKIPILIVTIWSLLLYIIFTVDNDKFLSPFGWDYFAYWSTGKIADKKGYSEIYDLNNLRSVQTQELESLGILSKTDDSPTRIIPAAYFSFFILPFQILSKIDLVYGYWLWTIFNLIILVGYLVFFMRKILPENDALINDLKLLIPILISFPVFMNIFNGQINVLLLVCAGEFIRNAVRKKPIFSGLWLGGLLIKPPSLILIIPIILIMRNWKVLMGFVVSSGIILVTSFILSGFAGIKAMINLWIGSSGGFTPSNPESMINWRMVGLNLNYILNSSLGWVIAGLGMILTILALYFLIQQIPPFGSPSWVITMLGVFSATLAVTWHAHQHMAMVLIPFLVYASLYKLLRKIILFSWAMVTTVVFFGMAIIGVPNNNFVMVVAFSGFVLNLVILFSALQFLNNNYLKQY